MLPVKNNLRDMQSFPRYLIFHIKAPLVHLHEMAILCLYLYVQYYNFQFCRSVDIVNRSLKFCGPDRHQQIYHSTHVFQTFGWVLLALIV